MTNRLGRKSTFRRGVTRNAPTEGQMVVELKSMSTMFSNLIKFNQIANGS